MNSMIKAIFYKEFIKCRAVVAVLFVIAVSLVGYMFVGNANLLRTSGAMTVWGQIADGSLSLLPLSLLYFMPAASIAIAVMQYSLEMANKRLKLTLHLPVPEIYIIGAMQFFGVAMVLALYVVMLVPAYVGLSCYYPSQFVSAMFISAVPYMLSGFAAYFFSMWIIVEPTWRRRAVYLFIAIGAMAPFVADAPLGASGYALPAFFVIVAAAKCASLYSVLRFKSGAQN